MSDVVQLDLTNVNDDLNDDAFELVSSQRFKRGQSIREQIVNKLIKNLDTTIADSEQSTLLLTTLRDIDNADNRRLSIKQEGKAQDNRERVLELLSNITKFTNGNPYRVEIPVEHTPNKPEVYYTGDDISAEEISVTDDAGNYDDFMKERRNLD